jgi:hypothetical protein
MFLLLARLGPVLLGMGGAGVARAEPEPTDPEVLARVTYPNPRAFREAVRKLRIEVVRILAFEKPEGAVTALVLMRKSSLTLAAQDPSVKVTIVAEPPANPADVPQVGTGNRFANPRVLPEGQGILRKGR